MHFSTDQQDATTVFRFKESRLDSRNAGQLKAEFLILSQPDIDTLIIDLTEVQHVDSAGLSALLLAHRQMASHEGEVRLVGASEDVQSLLRVTQLDRIFPLFNTVNEALDAEPSFGDDEDDEADGSVLLAEADTPLAPGAPSANDIRSGAIAAGGSFGAAALTRIMMTEYEEELDQVNILSFGDDEDYDDEEEDLDEDLDDDFEEDEEFAEEVADAEPAAEEVEEDDLLEDDDLDDDDFDEDDLDEEDDF